MLVLDAFIQPLPHTRLVVVTTCYATQVPMAIHQEWEAQDRLREGNKLSTFSLPGACPPAAGGRW